MYKKLLTVAVATTMTVFGLQAQSNLPRIETVNGKEKTERAAPEAYFDNTRHQSIAQRTNPYIINNKDREKQEFTRQKGEVTQQKGNFTNPKGEFIRLNDFTEQNGKIIRNDAKTLMHQEIKPHKTVIPGDIKPSIVRERNFKPSYSVKKSDRDDVATITLRVIGDPYAEWGYVNCGFQLLLDEDATMLDDEELFFDYFFYDWVQIYNQCEYTIPEGLTGNIETDPIVLDSECTITIPGGIYDIAFVLPYPPFDRLFTTRVYLPGNDLFYYWDNLYSSYFDDFEFISGYEYVFQAEIPNMIDFYPENDVCLRKVILPTFSSELTDQEEVSVVLYNGGVNDIIGDIYLSFRVNNGAWTTTETFAVNLAPGEELPYTYIAKADLSENGFHTVEAKVDYELDMFNPNNVRSGNTKKPFPLKLPFYEDFADEESLYANWQVLNLNNTYWDGCEWMYNDWNLDPDGGYGCLQVNVIPYDPPEYIEDANDYLISDPMIFPEAGTYHISFYTYPFEGYETLRILYGTTSDYTEMEVLDVYECGAFSLGELWISYPEWIIYINHFEIETPGNYYFAFHYCTPGGEFGGAIDFDNVKIGAGEFVGIPDILFTSASRPVPSCDMGDDEVIGMTVRNRGSEPINEFTLTYQVDDGPIVSQTFNETVAIREMITVYWDVPPDFSAIGDYTVKFTASTPNEVNTDNNEAEIIVTHYAPITEFPYTGDFGYDWNPEPWRGWFWNSWYQCYYPAWWEYTNVPLISRCFTLEPDTYLFKFEYSAGREANSDDFYIAYGLSGTDPHQWTPAKEFLNMYTGNGIIIWEEFFLFEITEPGDYVFAFFYLGGEGDLGIFSSTVEVAPEYDFGIQTIDTGISARLTPAYQLSGENTFTATLINKGKEADVSGNIELFLNNNSVTSVNFAFTEIGETKDVEIKLVLETIPVGEMSLLFNANIENGLLEKEWETLIAISDSTFAYDNIDTEFFYANAIGYAIPAGLGLIYELAKSDILTSITVGLMDGTPYGYTFEGVDIGLAVYDVNENILGNKYFEVFYPRTSGDNEKGITFDVPDTELEPGTYYFDVIQLDGVNIGVVEDGDRDGYFYVHDYVSTPGTILRNYVYGYIHLRPNFGNPPVGISREKAPETQLTLYPNPAKGVLNVSLGETAIEKAVVYNASGQVIASISNINDSKFMFDTEKLSSGFYFIMVQSRDGIVNGKFVVK